MYKEKGLSFKCKRKTSLYLQRGDGKNPRFPTPEVTFSDRPIGISHFDNNAAPLSVNLLPSTSSVHGLSLIHISEPTRPY